MNAQQHRINQLEDALVWASAAADFQEGGAAREGFLRTVQPLLEDVGKRDYKSPMETYLDRLIEEGDGTAAVQILFAPGVKMQAGAIAHTPIEGLYKFGTIGHVSPDAAKELGADPGQPVALDIVFDGKSVLQVVTQMDTAGIITPHRRVEVPQ